MSDTQTVHKYPTRAKCNRQSSATTTSNHLVEVTGSYLRQQKENDEEQLSEVYSRQIGTDKENDAIQEDWDVGGEKGEQQQVDNPQLYSHRRLRRSSGEQSRSGPKTPASEPKCIESSASDSGSDDERPCRYVAKRKSRKGRKRRSEDEVSQMLIKFMDQQSQRWEGLLERFAPKESASAADGVVASKDKVPKFKELRKGDDVATYLDNFEDYMENWAVPKKQWTYRLLPLLTQEAMDVFSTLQADSKKNYTDVRKALNRHFCVTREGYKQKIDEVSRMPGEHWMECGRRILRLVQGWTEHCKSVDELREWIAADSLLRIMPHQIASRVRERRPNKLEDTAQWADDYWASLNWDYRIVQSINKQSKNLGTKKFSRSQGNSSTGLTRGGTADNAGNSSVQATDKDSKLNASAEVRATSGDATREKTYSKDGMRCFVCQKTGHFKSECPQRKKERVNLVQHSVLEEINLNELPSRSEELRLAERYIQDTEVIVHGKVNGKPVSTIYLDTGAQRTIVKGKWIEPENYRDGTVELGTCRREFHSYPTALVMLEACGREDKIEVAVDDNLAYDVLLGRDFAGLREVVVEEFSKAVANLVQTRAQAVAAEKQLQENLDMDSKSEVKETPISLSDSEQEGENTDFMVETNEMRQDDEDNSLTETSEQEEIELSGPEKTKKSRAEKRAERQQFELLQNARVGVDEDVKRLRMHQQGDESLKPIRDAIISGSSEFVINNGLIWRSASDRLGDKISQLVLPKDYRGVVLRMAHRPGHLGRDNTKKIILDDFYWPGLSGAVTKLCHSCEECQKSVRRRHRYAPLKVMPIIKVPFTRIAMDMVGPLERTKSGHRHILVIMDYSTRWPEAFPMKNTDSRAVADVLCELFTRTGVPEEILSDCGSNFISKTMQELYKLLGIKGIKTTPYHPQTDGMVERFNQTMKRMLKKSLGAWNGQWDKALPYVLGEYRTMPNETTRFTPSELYFGRQIRTPLKALKERWTADKPSSENVANYFKNLTDRFELLREAAKENEVASKSKYKTQYDKKSQERSFNEGDLVLLRIPQWKGGLKAEWEGPYVVNKKLSDLTYELQMPGHPRRRGKYHINLLTPYTSPTAECLLVADKAEDFEVSYLPGQDKDTQELPRVEKDLSEQQQEKLIVLLKKHEHGFSTKPGKTTEAEITIETGDAYPVHQPAYRVPYSKMDILRLEVKYLLENGLIRPSTSPWASPVLLVPKPDGSMRMCVDYRRLNKLTKPDPFPMPRIEDLLDRLGRSVYISTLDLSKGYYQIPVHKESIPKTAFITPTGKYEFLVMPFGLMGAPSVFQRFMNSVLADMPEFCSAYIDDIVVFSTTFEDHLSHLDNVLERLHSLGLTVKPGKCQLARKECTFLGHRVGGGKVRPLEAKVECLKEYPCPTKKKDMMAFLGLANYYRRFVPNFASIACPLTDSIKKKSPDKITWTTELHNSFDTLKEALVSNQVLISPDPSRPFILQTDASGIGIGAVLSQMDPESDTDRPVAYYSRKLLPRETRYFVTEQECLAVVDSVKHFHVYLTGVIFTIVTDHSSLQYLDRLKDLNNRLTRWALTLQPYSYKIVHRSGKSNANADGLSRQSWNRPALMDPGEKLQVQETAPCPKKGGGDVTAGPRQD